MGDNKGGNNGCLLIVIILGIIGSLAYFFSSTSKESIAETGTLILTVIGLIIGYIIFKMLFSNKLDASDTSENKGCLKLILIAAAFIIFVGFVIGILTSSFNFNIGVGALAIIVFAIIIGIWLYNNASE